MPILGTRAATRAAVVTTVAGGVLWLPAAPAAAHVEVSAEPAQAGARNAVVSFSADAESRTAGIASVKIQLPAGISAGMVSLAGGPVGWKLATPQEIVTIGGPALMIGRDAAYAIRIARLPAARTLVFKTIVAYGDGTEDSWIDLPTAGGGEPDSPAPVLRLAPAAPSTALAPTTAPAPTTAATSPVPAPTTAPRTAATTAPPPRARPAPGDDGGPGAGIWIGVAAAVALIAGGGTVLARWSRAG